MGFVADFKSLISKHFYNHVYAKMLNGQTPVFTSFGKNIYAYDIMKNAIAVNCTEISKLEPRHVRIDSMGNQNTVNSSINRLLKIAPNPYMTISDFLFKCNWLYETTDNCYIYPIYEKEYNGDRSQYRRIYTGFYPLDPENVEFTENTAGKIFVKFSFGGGYEIEVPYADVIHWKKNVTSYDIAGGFSGDYQDRSLINLLNADNTAIQGIDKAVKSKLSVNGILKINTMADQKLQQKKLEEFEELLQKAQSGIIPTDIKAEYTPFQIDPKLIDKNTMEFIQKRILARVGVSLEIYNRKFTEEDYQGYYELTLSSRIKSLGEAFGKALFTPMELSFGNQIIAYNQGLRYASLSHKIEAIDVASRIGVLNGNQIASILGYPPYEGGETRYVSLNYMDMNYLTDYQMRDKAESYSKESAEQESGGKNENN